MPYERIARLSVGPTNHNPVELMDSARRKADHFGFHGFKAKSGQTNDLFLEQGHVDLSFPTIEMRAEFVELVFEYCDPAIVVRLLKRKRR